MKYLILSLQSPVTCLCSWPARTEQLFYSSTLPICGHPLYTGWDRPICTEGIVSVPRGNPAVMTCNISNTFTDVTIQLSAHGKDRIIFNKKPQGSFSWFGWELRVQGGQAQLVIKDTQDNHTGLYLWQLHGRQRYYRNITLNISGGVRAVEQEDGRG